MPDMTLFSGVRRALPLTLLILSGCTPPASPVASRTFQIQQDWQFQPGQQIAGYEISGGLGDISIELNGDSIRAPFSGEVYPHEADCVVFISPEVPAYLLRFCGLRRPQPGSIRQGEVIGTAQSLQFAALRKQPDGTWALVEPSTEILEKTLR